MGLMSNNSVLLNVHTCKTCETTLFPFNMYILRHRLKYALHRRVFSFAQMLSKYSSRDGSLSSTRDLDSTEWFGFLTDLS